MENSDNSFKTPNFSKYLILIKFSICGKLPLVKFFHEVEKNLHSPPFFSVDFFAMIASPEKKEVVVLKILKLLIFSFFILLGCEDLPFTDEDIFNTALNSETAKGETKEELNTVLGQIQSIPKQDLTGLQAQVSSINCLEFREILSGSNSKSDKVISFEECLRGQENSLFSNECERIWGDFKTNWTNDIAGFKSSL